MAATLSACGGDDSTSAGGGGTTTSPPAEETSSPPSGGSADKGSGESSGGDGGTTEESAGDAAQQTGSDGTDGGSGENGGGSGEASAEFRTPGGDNSVQEYGSEADDAERAAASAVVEAFMAARAAGDWASVCSTVSASVAESIENVTTPGAGCVGAFEAIGKRLPPGAFVNTMTGPIASLRAKGGQGFALFHGKEGQNYLIQVSREAGGWKVNALEPTPLP